MHRDALALYKTALRVTSAGQRDYFVDTPHTSRQISSNLHTLCTDTDRTGGRGGGFVAGGITGEVGVVVVDALGFAAGEGVGAVGVGGGGIDPAPGA